MDDILVKLIYSNPYNNTGHLLTNLILYTRMYSAQVALSS